jgi:transcriptional antiterminator RfaH
MAEHCASHNLVHYLPVRSETKIYQRRKVTVQKPVFPGYVFAAFSEEERTLVLKSSSLARIIPVEDQERFIREIDQIRKALEVDATLGGTAAFTRGKPVRITAGPFRGIEGIVESERGAARVVLNVRMIGRGIAVEVETDMLEPLN